ncbi:hypothetical protein [Streptomyces sp. NPDC020571]|uniref:hypothetical protein n=1 Tax=Streptomyces sp. NPDC020571 TaxID=3365079 RepID=UPI0037BA867E
MAIKLVHRAYAADPEFRKRFTLKVAADLDADEPWPATAYDPGPPVGRRRST